MDDSSTPELAQAFTGSAAFGLGATSLGFGAGSVDAGVTPEISATAPFDFGADSFAWGVVPLALGVTAFGMAPAATVCATGLGGSLFVIGLGVLFSVGVGSAGTVEGVLFCADAAFFLSNSWTGVGRWTFSVGAPSLDFLLRHCRTLCSRL